MKIKLSKSQWEELGKKAGWDNESQNKIPPGALDWTPPAKPSENINENQKLSPFANLKRLISKKSFGIAETGNPDGSREITFIFEGGKQLKIKGDNTQSSGTWEFV